MLAVPSDAIRIENGHDFCFVVSDDGLERREVKLGQVTSELSEVTEGLEEGEQVVINPPKDDTELKDMSVRDGLTWDESLPWHGSSRRRSPHCTDRIERTAWRR